MGYALAGIRAKIDRGIDHLDELDRLARAFLTDDSYVLTNDLDPDENCQVTRFRVVREPPSKFGIIAGEAIGQFRSALDHLGVQLACLKNPGRVSANFPIYSDRKVYVTPTGKQNRSPRDYCTRAFRSQDLARIERMQPYQHTSPENHGLAILQRLSNIDKHRVIHTPFARLTQLSLSTPDPNTGIEIIRAEFSTTGPLEDGAELARYRTIGDGKVPVEWKMGVGLGYGEEGFTFEVVKQLGIGVIGIVDEFESAIPELRRSV